MVMPTSSKYQPNIESDFPRDTLVVEATFIDPVGSVKASEEKISNYLYEASAIIGFEPLRSPVTHFSPKYGFSGWVPLKRDAALHLYAWDEEGKETRPFISVDISTADSLLNRADVVEHLRQFIGGTTATIVFKSLRSAPEKNAQTWIELAGHIVRQRLAIVGKTAASFRRREIGAFLSVLCRVLEMEQLSGPLVQGNAAWMHWETSGVIASWARGTFAADIYTCKSFNPADAIDCAQRVLKLKEVISKDF